MFGLSPTSRNSFLHRMRQFFGFSQNELATCLGISREQFNHAERGHRPLPLAAALPHAALTVALHQCPPDPEPEPLDLALVRRRIVACRHQAGQWEYKLLQMHERAQRARRRLAVLPMLTATLAPAGTPPPFWLARFDGEARDELLRSGSTAQALLRLRIDALIAEADAATQLLEASVSPAADNAAQASAGEPVVSNDAALMAAASASAAQ